MEFEIAGRRVILKKEHFFIVIAVFLAFFVLNVLAGFSYLYLETFVSDGAMDVLLVLATVIGPFVLFPLHAWFLLMVAGVLGMKKDLHLCRSIAAAEFVIILLLFMANFMLAFSLEERHLMEALGTLAGIATAVVLVYLWMLIFIEFDRERLKKSALYAVVLAIAMLALDKAAGFLVEYSQWNVSLIKIDGSIGLLASSFVFSLALIYHILGRKLDQAAYLFAGFYLASKIFLFIGNSSALSMGDITGVADLVRDILGLGLIYFMSRKG